jgi:hypothetical protein
MASDHTTDGRGGGLSPSEFEQALREATAGSECRGFGPRTAPIPDLRRALRGRITRDEFDQGLRHLRQEAIVDLAPHGHPEFLSVSEAQGAMQEGGSVLYLLRWLK